MPKIDVVNGWRGYAILAVLVVHSFARMPPESLGPLLWVFKSGWIGVNAFFIASGFVLYLPFVTGRRTMTSLADGSQFLRHRAARLIPLCFIGSFVAFVMFTPPPVTEWKFWAYIVNFPLATFSWIGGINVLNGNGALWSISVEIVLSALLPFLVPAVRRFGLPQIFIVVAAFWLCHRLVLALFTSAPIAAVQSAIGLGWFGMFYGDVVGISLVEFMLGMMLAAAYAAGRHEKMIERWTGALLTVGGALVAAFCTLFWRTWGEGFDPHSPKSVSDAFLPLLLDAGLGMMFAGMLWARERSSIWWLFANWPIQILGLMCYSLYVWHPPLLTKLGNPLGVTAEVFAATLAVVLLFSAISYCYIEFPKRKLAELFLWRPRSVVLDDLNPSDQPSAARAAAGGGRPAGASRADRVGV